MVSTIFHFYYIIIVVGRYKVYSCSFWRCVTSCSTRLFPSPPPSLLPLPPLTMCRALFTHKHSRSNNELQFLRGDVFRVCDTLPQGMKNYWKVLRIDYFGSEINSGYIPIEQRYMYVIWLQ